MGDLWLDIVNKTYATRILDPNNGEEKPRTERARIYNNIGLYLYNQARDLSRARVEIVSLIARYEPAKKRDGDLLTTLAQREISGMELRIVKLYNVIEVRTASQLDHIRVYFISSCK